MLGNIYPRRAPVLTFNNYKQRTSQDRDFRVFIGEAKKKKKYIYIYIYTIGGSPGELSEELVT